MKLAKLIKKYATKEAKLKRKQDKKLFHAYSENFLIRNEINFDKSFFKMCHYNILNVYIQILSSLSETKNFH